MKRSTKRTLLLILIGIPLASGLLVVASFLFLVTKLQSGYEIQNGVVLFRSFNNLNWKIERKEVADADPNHLKTLRRSGGLYASDGVKVFHEASVISGADPSTFRVLDWRGGYGRDAEQVFWATIPMSRDPENFKILGAGYSLDSKFVYNGSKPIEGADPESFEVVDPVVFEARDKNHRYNLGRIIEDD